MNRVCETGLVKYITCQQIFPLTLGIEYILLKLNAFKFAKYTTNLLGYPSQ